MRSRALRQSTPQRALQVRKWKWIRVFPNLTALYHVLILYNKYLIFLNSVSGSQGNVSGPSQTGDTLGKALASVSTTTSILLDLSPESPSGIMQNSPIASDRTLHIKKSYSHAARHFIGCSQVK